MRRVRIIVLCLCLSVAAGCGSDDDKQAADALRQSAATHDAARDGLAQQDAEAAATTPAPSVTDPPPPAASESGAPDSAPGALLSTADRASFRTLAASLPGGERLAVSGTGLGQPVEAVGELDSGVAWSTAKVPVAMAAIDQGVGSQADLTAAITASDNAAAERLFTALGADGAAAATDQVRAAGDPRTTIRGDRLRASFTAFGQSSWAITDQARFAAGLGCVSAGQEVLGLMRRTIPGQRWGLGQIGSSPAIKGGWGPGTTPGNADGWLERQLGVVQIHGRPIAIVIASTAPNHEAGTRALDRLASWAEQHVGVSGVDASASC